MTIFISIASYSDKLLSRTITRALETAHRPDLLRFGVIDQSILDPSQPKIQNIASGQINYVNIHPTESRGACWARSLAMSLYSGETWFLQLDSHMDFDSGWDIYIKEKALEAQINKVPGVISSYPPGFNFDDNGKAVFNRYDDAIMYNGLVENQQFKDDYPGLHFVSAVKVSKETIHGYHIGGGFLFAPGNFVYHFPYDPWFYFIGEEQSMSIRLYTHGWHIYHIPALPVYHLYNTGNSGRVLHWDTIHDQNRQTRWWKLEDFSKERFKDLCFQRRDLGIFGLGTKRSLNDFANYCGIDYPNRIIRTDSELKRING